MTLTRQQMENKIAFLAKKFGVCFTLDVYTSYGYSLFLADEDSRYIRELTPNRLSRREFSMFLSGMTRSTELMA
jgi:hypothetical protein